MADTKQSREKKGRVKERQLLEADVEAAVEVVDGPPEPPSDDEDAEEHERSFEG